MNTVLNNPLFVNKIIKEKPEQEKSITPTEEVQEVLPDDGYVLNKVKVGPIPSEYIIPSGELEINENGVVDVTEIKTINVNTPVSKTNLLINNKLEELTAEDIAIPGEVTRIGNNALYGKTRLKKVTLPNETLSIGDNAFYGCTNLVEISGLDNVEMIGSSAFYNCSNLALNFKSNKIKSVSGSAFSNCKKLGNLYFSNQCTIAQYSFQGTTIQRLRLGTIGTNNFNTVLNQGTITNSLEFNEGVTQVTNFGNLRNAPKIILPTTLQSISFSSLYGEGETNLIIKAETPPTLSAVISVIERIFVPLNAISDYKTKTNWSASASIIYPLVNTFEDLINIDEAVYQYACVKGNELGIEDENNYKVYQLIDGQWFEV